MKNLPVHLLASGDYAADVSKTTTKEISWLPPQEVSFHWAEFPAGCCGNSRETFQNKSHPEA